MNWISVKESMPPHLSKIAGIFYAKAFLKKEFCCSAGTGNCEVTLKWQGMVNCNYHFYGNQIKINFRNESSSFVFAILQCTNFHDKEMSPYWPEKYIKEISCSLDSLRYWVLVPKLRRETEMTYEVD